MPSTIKQSAMARLQIYVLYHDDASQVKANEICKQAPYLVSRKLEAHPLFESQFYLSPISTNEWAEYDYIGTITYNYHEKIGIPVSDIPATISTALRKADHESADIVFLNNAPNTDATSIAQEGSNGHGPMFRQCWISLLSRLGYDVSDTLASRHPICWNNYWLAKPHAMREYCNFVKRAWRVLLASPDLVALYDTDAKWNSRLSKRQLENIFRKPYYAMYPFVFERLPGFYFSTSGFHIALVRASPELIIHQTYQVGNSVIFLYVAAIAAIILVLVGLYFTIV